MEHDGFTILMYDFKIKTKICLNNYFKRRHNIYHAFYTSIQSLLSIHGIHSLAIKL